MARQKQRGIVLLICLMLLIMVMLLGVSATQLYLQGEQAARGERDREVAFQSAEDTLMDAELDIQCGPGGTGNPLRCAAFSASTAAQADASDAPSRTPSSATRAASLSVAPAASLNETSETSQNASPSASLSVTPAASPSGASAVAPVAPVAFAAECGGGAAAAGLRLRAPSGEPPVWQSVDLSGVEDGGACTVEHGAFTGAEMQTGQGFLPFKKPRYLIERMECHQPGDDAAASAGPHYCYRVTAIGFGARSGMEVVLQTVLAKPE